MRERVLAAAAKAFDEAMEELGLGKSEQQKESAQAERPVPIRELLSQAGLPTDRAMLKRLEDRLRRYRDKVDPSCCRDNDTRLRNLPRVFYFPSRVAAVVDSLRARERMRL